MPESVRKIVVTSALPYANGPIHIGHLVEYIQTDIWVRFQKMRGHECHYVCADDAHGTPIMLKAEAEGISPEQLIAEVGEAHRRDFADFAVAFDNYYSTHSPENREISEYIYGKALDKGFIAVRTIAQAYDPVKQMFLPDRFIRGTCPRCKTPDQYGDSCEVCGATYAPTDLLEPTSALSGVKPELRESEHLFFRLGAFEELLKRWLTEHDLQQGIVNKLNEWFDAGLKDWDISRDPPYFGFEIPDHPGKYFYVWLDAPIGYLASFKNLCAREGLDFDAYWPPAQRQRQRQRDLSFYRQGHHVFPHAVLARHAQRRRLQAADERLCPRLPYCGRTEDVQIARNLHYCAYLPRSPRCRIPALLFRRQAGVGDRRHRSEP